MRRLAILLCLQVLTARAEYNPLRDNTWYWAAAQGSFSSGTYAPFWFTANQHGLATPNPNSGLIDIGVMTPHPYPIRKDNRDWRLSYGLEMAAPFGMDSHFVLQQAFAEIQWKRYLRLSLGQKRRGSLRDYYLDDLSTGGLTTGINARPLPQARLETPGYITIPGTKDWLGIHAHIAYGWYTDNGWQRNFTDGTNNKYTKYTANSLYHTKALLFQIGNYENNFPFVATGGLEMSSQFGGEAWNVMQSLNTTGGTVTTYNEKIDSGLKAYWNALIPGGSDSNDGNFGNRAGNQLGSWHAKLYWKGSGTGWWGSVYMEHFFEDQSQMFLQYAWKDMLVGVNVGLPDRIFRNIVKSVTYEYIGTKDQSGPVYHDATPTLPEQISAVDEYYNNHIYGAWQHAGFTMGNPLLLSPIYNIDGRNDIYVAHNRIKAHHIGLRGEPMPFLSWRLMFTHEESWGTYQRPLVEPKKGNFLLAEVTYKVHHVKGLRLGLAYGHNDGSLLGRSNGVSLCVVFANYLGSSIKKKK